MKRLLIIVLALAMVFSFAACGTKQEANGGADTPQDRLAKIKAAGVLQVATEPYFAPYEYIDPKASKEDQIQGFDIEMAKYIADKIGVKLELVPLDFTAVLAGTADGKYDMAISAISYSPSREDAMRLSKGYYFSDTGYGFIVREEDKGKYNSIEDLKDAVVITQSGSVQEAIFNTYIGTGKCKEFKLTAQMTDGYLAVQENKADVCIVSCTSAQLYADANGGMAVPDFRFTVDPEMNSVRVACPIKDTESLIEIVNQCIDELIAKDQINKWADEFAVKAKELGI